MAITDNHNLDDSVDIDIAKCLNYENPSSFFLFAGAGSGKTTSLIKALKHIKEKYGTSLKLNGQKVGVITYTNAAKEEIEGRIDYDNLFQVSTIHSFVWELIKPFTDDIKLIIQASLKESIIDLKEKQSRIKKVSKTSIDRERKITAKEKRLLQIEDISQFTYNPNGENKNKDSLNHFEVLSIASEFLSTKKLMQRILVSKFPFLLIDESQDTNKNLVEALLKVEKEFEGRFSLGLIGDMMQRIYLDGKANLGDDDLPERWAKPVKQLNYRCPKRIVDLINKIRKQSDGQEQVARSDAKDGIVRFYIFSQEIEDKSKSEEDVCTEMAKITKDKFWTGVNKNVQTLTLEHHMAAQRLGFTDLFEPLYHVSKLKTGIIDGTNIAMRFFTKLILPLYLAFVDEDKFTIARIIKQNSLLISKSKLKDENKQLEQIKKAKLATESLYQLWDDSKDPTLLDILQEVYKSSIFPIPEPLNVIAQRSSTEIKKIEESKNEDTDADEIIDAWDKSLLSPFSQIKLYSTYIEGEASIDTHQGVKGREFPRVMIILDDNSARGPLFSYEKLFGVIPLSDRDKKNKSEGKDTGIDRTLRLFYVTCSRAKESLALVAYSQNPELLAKNVIQNGWFRKDEIVLN